MSLLVPWPASRQTQRLLPESGGPPACRAPRIAVRARVASTGVPGHLALIAEGWSQTRLHQAQPRGTHSSCPASIWAPVSALASLICWTAAHGSAEGSTAAAIDQRV